MSAVYRHNVMSVTSVSTFARVKGGYNHGNRDVYFLRFIGGNENLKKEIEEVDALLGTAMNQRHMLYKRLSGLNGAMTDEERTFYIDCYSKWIESGQKMMTIHAQSDNTEFGRTLSNALIAAESEFDKAKSGNSDSIRRNFIIKLIKWTDDLMKDYPEQWTERACIKMIAENITKQQEYLFFYMMTLLGADVVLLQTGKDIEGPQQLLNLSKAVRLGDYVSWTLPEYSFECAQEEEIKTVLQSAKPVMDSTAEIPHAPVRVHIPKHTETGKSGISGTPPKQSSVMTERAAQGGVRQEKSFEELALLASSIVMVAIHDQTGKAVGSGSGIMIGRDGYILTNNHVVSGGRYFSIRIEEDDNIYKTDEVIKYNYSLDLAIIRIQRELSPLPVYDGSAKLVRGQKVVAIGSPLGLFNSVSDGIISGFRNIDHVEMIQFTAPTSHGSSGGAVLNMYGEVIGISTAGIDSGQNINLAVPYDSIAMFIKGFC